ncbi:MAG TPA: hypothetical protein VGJ94_10500 [Syntrophorhabdaceae bacterium]|jgi:hypothetical protein
MAIESLIKRKYLINIILAVAAAAIMVFYALCTTSCSYLKGAILGLDLKYAGIIAMAVVVVLSLLKKDLLLLPVLSMGIGAEAFLVSFQVKNEVYCPYCLAYGVILVLLFLLNIDFRRKWTMILFAIVGLLAFVLLFKGSAMPVYAMR